PVSARVLAEARQDPCDDQAGEFRDFVQGDMVDVRLQLGRKGGQVQHGLLFDGGEVGTKVEAVQKDLKSGAVLTRQTISPPCSGSERSRPPRPAGSSRW